MKNINDKQNACHTVTWTDSDGEHEQELLTFAAAWAFAKLLREKLGYMAVQLVISVP